MGLWCKSCLAKSMAREQSYRNKYVYRIIARLSGMIFLDMWHYDFAKSTSVSTFCKSNTSTLLYIYIYILCLSGGLVSFVPASHECSTLPPRLDVSALTPPLLTMCSEPVLWKCSYGPWDRFMFSVNGGILCVCVFLPLSFHFCCEHTDFHFYCWFAGSIMPKLGKALICLRFPFGKGTYFVEIPILRICVHLSRARWI